MEALPEHLKEVRPTIFFGVPRLWEKMQSVLSQRLAAATGIKGLLAGWALGVARRWHLRVLDGRPGGAWTGLQLALARRLVLDKVKRALGLDRARLLISGAAPIAAEGLRFFLGLDLVVRELYGQTEVGGPTTVSLPGSTRIGSVGRALPGLELRIAEDGEVLVRSPAVFQGYAGDPAATAEALQDGWLHSGDLGQLDADGYLSITGRKKDLIITSGGKNISPANLEAELMSLALVEHAVVLGDGRHFLAALLTLKPEAAQAFATAHGLELAGLGSATLLREALQREIDAINARHARVATLRKFAVVDGGFSIAEGELTATLKLRRRIVIERYRERVEALYREAQE
jgi:long-chain acyl-CoA synthetase